MISRILVCAANGRERDYWMHLAKQDGAELDPAKRRALFPALELELRFEILEHRHDADKLRGLELAGVLNLRAVRIEEIRSMIFSRIRP